MKSKNDARARNTHDTKVRESVTAVTKYNDPPGMEFYSNESIDRPMPVLEVEPIGFNIEYTVLYCMSEIEGRNKNERELI